MPRKWVSYLFQELILVAAGRICLTIESVVVREVFYDKGDGFRWSASLSYVAVMRGLARRVDYLHRLYILLSQLDRREEGVGDSAMGDQVNILLSSTLDDQK